MADKKKAQIRKQIVGDFLRQSRERAGLSQADVAEQFGYTSAQFVSNWERGVAMPPLGALPQLADLYRLAKQAVIGTMVQYLEEMSRIEIDEIERSFRRRKKS